MKQEHRWIEKIDPYIRTKELCTLLGITQTAIRHYEKYHHIQEDREENGYRRYIFNDVQQLLNLKAYAGMGFRVAEAARLSEEGASGTLPTQLEEQAEYLERDAKLQLRKAEYMRNKRGILQELSSWPMPYRQCVRPGFYWLQCTEGTRVLEGRKQEAALRDLGAVMPFAESSPRMRAEHLNLASVAELGLCVRDVYADLLRPETLLTMKHENPCSCIYGIVRANRDVQDYYSVIEEGLQYLEEHNLELKGDVVTILIAANYRLDDANAWDYYECYFPI